MTFALKIPYMVLSTKPKVSLSTTIPESLFLATGRGRTQEKAEAELRVSVLVALEALATRGIDGVTPLLETKAGDGYVAVKPSECWAILLRYERVKAKLTQATMAKRLGITQPSYSRMERVGYKPSIDNALIAEAALGVNILARFKMGPLLISARRAASTAAHRP